MSDIKILIPENVIIELNNRVLSVKSSKDKLVIILNSCISVDINNNLLKISHSSNTKNCRMQVNTTYSLIKNMIIGVTKGFTRTMCLVGIGYRASIKDNVLSLFVGLSHPINYVLPTGVTVKCPNQTEIILKSTDKQLIGQVAANIRSYRRPEPYKGKGIRYFDEIINIKETKKSK